jgi:hypothetical protein
MEKVLLTVLAGVLAGMTFAPARADDDADKRFEFNGEIRARYEYLNNYIDQTDQTGSGHAFDDSASFTAYRATVGVTGMFAKNITAHVDLDYVGHFGDAGMPSDVFVGTGYENIIDGVSLYQGWFEMGKIGGSDFGVRIGRQEHAYGTELFLGDRDYYFGLAFDGARGMWQHGSNDLNLFYYKIAEGNDPFVIGSTNGAQDNSFFGATYDWNFRTWGTVGGYWLISQDLSNTMKVSTCGARWNRGMMNGDKLNMFDWNIEYAVQSGDDTPTVKIAAWIGEGWFAYNFNAGQNTHGRVHIGTLMTSGQKNTTATKDEDFVSLYGDFHANNRFGDMDWVDSATLPALGGAHNITDYNIGYEHWFGTDHYVMFAYHMFKETEANGAPDDTIGDEIDLKYGYQYSKNLSFEVMLGQANPDEKFFGAPADAVQRAAAQAKVRW